MITKLRKLFYDYFSKRAYEISEEALYALKFYPAGSYGEAFAKTRLEIANLYYAIAEAKDPICVIMLGVLK